MQSSTCSNAGSKNDRRKTTRNSSRDICGGACPLRGVVAMPVTPSLAASRLYRLGSGARRYDPLWKPECDDDEPGQCPGQHTDERQEPSIVEHGIARPEAQRAAI